MQNFSEQEVNELEDTSKISTTNTNTKKQFDNNNIDFNIDSPKKLNNEKLKDVLLKPENEKIKKTDTEINILSESEDLINTEEIDLSNIKYDEIVKKHKKEIYKQTAFNLFEKEKCKYVNFKEVDLRQYISEISKIWRNMDDKQREKYVILSNIALKQYEESLNGEELKIYKFLTNKKKRPSSNKKPKKIKNNLKKLKQRTPRKPKKEIEVLSLDEDSEINTDSGDLNNTSMHKTYKNKNKQNIKNQKNKKGKSKTNLINENIEELKENHKENNKIKKKRNNSSFLEMKEEANPENFNQYFNSVVMPFIVNSYQFMKNNMTITNINK